MPQVTFESVSLNGTYSRNTLAELWGYAGFEAIARGVVTPANDNKIVLFVTGNKRNHDEQYHDSLVGGVLDWDGPKDHFAEQRMVDAAQTGDEIHLFYRDEHKADFAYLGQLKVQAVSRHADCPSRFMFALTNSK
jgi:hypothetical protein